MKIAIYHNLPKGGALNLAISIIKELKSDNTIHVFSFNKNIPEKYIEKTYIFTLKKTNNVFEHIFQILFELKHQNKKIAELIKKNNYDLVLIFPCFLTQSPYVIRFLNHIKGVCFYFFTETKREFYEMTSFDYYSIKRTLTRFIRFPIKIIDKKNCRNAKNIISISNYTRNVLNNNYKKNSFIVYPGLKEIKPLKLSITNNKNFISIGILSKIKGHDFSIKQIEGKPYKLSLLGRVSSIHFRRQTFRLF